MTSKDDEDKRKRIEFLRGKQKLLCDDIPIAKKLIEKLEGENEDTYFVAREENEKNIRDLLERGRYFNDKDNKIILDEMDERACHSNSAEKWKKYIDEMGDGEKIKMFICTGYYKTGDDYVWRQHTWLVNDENRVYETTVPAKIYYGYILTTIECIFFVLNEGILNLKDIPKLMKKLNLDINEFQKFIDTLTLIQ